VAAVKSGGPDLAAWARDVIVICVSSDSTVDAVIQSFRRYPVKEHCVDELVRSTQGVSGLAGVGIGADPPHVDLLEEEYLKIRSPAWTRVTTSRGSDNLRSPSIERASSTRHWWNPAPIGSASVSSCCEAFSKAASIQGIPPDRGHLRPPFSTGWGW
jgi:hypothetical protein